MRYDKPALTFDQQIELLESRGLIVPDKARAANYLSNISYYRLSAYMLPFKVAGVNEFQANVTFDDVLHLYLFDREFRLLIFDAIERIEIAFRTQMSYQLAHAGGAFWFEDRNHFRDANRWREQLENLDVEVNRAKEVFKDHFFKKYDENERMPIWMCWISHHSINSRTSFYHRAGGTGFRGQRFCAHLFINRGSFAHIFLSSDRFPRAAVSTLSGG